MAHLRRSLCLLTLLLFCGWQSLLADVKIEYRNGWKALWIKGPELPSSGMYFLKYSNLTTFAFGAEAFYPASGSNVIPLDLPDGRYSYQLQTADGSRIESGSFILSTPFDLSEIFPGQNLAEFEGWAAEPLEVSLSMTSRYGNRTEKLKFPGRQKIEGLKPGTEYTFEFQGRGGVVSRSFKTLPPNLALGRPVFGSFNRLPESRFVYDETPAISRITDGRREWYQGMAYSSEVNTSDQVALIQLVRREKFSKVVVVWHARAYPETYNLMYSSDFKAWNTLERKSSSYRSSIAPDHTPLLIDTVTNEFEALYVGVFVQKGAETRNDFRGILGLLEVEIYE